MTSASSDDLALTFVHVGRAAVQVLLLWISTVQQYIYQRATDMHIHFVVLENILHYVAVYHVDQRNIVT